MKLNTTLPALHCTRRMLLVGVIACAALLQACAAPIVFVGIGAGALAVADRRTTGTYLEDESIELKTARLIRRHFGTINHVNVTSYNRNVLLTGEVQNEDVKAEVQRLAGTVRNVNAVFNELVIAAPSTFPSRSNDTAITANVKARFLSNNVFAPNHVKVVTEANIVFLLGIVTNAEGDRAAEIASTSKGVAEVIRVFEYIAEDEAQALDTRNTTNADFPPETH